MAFIKNNLVSSSGGELSIITKGSNSISNIVANSGTYYVTTTLKLFAGTYCLIVQCTGDNSVMASQPTLTVDKGTLTTTTNSNKTGSSYCASFTYFITLTEDATLSVKKSVAMIVEGYTGKCTITCNVIGVA